MGFWKSFFGGDNSNQSRGKKSNLDTTFVSYSEEREFEESIYGTLQLYDAEVSYIEEVLPEKGASLKKQIDLLLQLLEKSNSEDNPEVRRAFEELKSQFEEDKRLADGEYTISELEHQNRIMDSMFEKAPVSGGINKQKLDEYIDFISRVQRKVKEREERGTPILTKVQRQKFNVVSMKSEYRIKMLELMYLESNGSTDINPFLGLSETKQKMFSKMFFEDAKFAATQYEVLSYHEDAYNMYRPFYFNSIDDMAKRLNAQLENAKMIDDFSIRQIFDSERDDSKSFDFLKRFVRFKSTINEMMRIKDTVLENKNKKDAEEKAKEDEERAEQERIEAEKAEQERAEQERLEKYRDFTDADIRKEIDRIEHDISAKGSRYVNILDFQKEVARAKGLLDTEANLTKEGLVTKSVDAVDASKIVELANVTGISYAAFPDCQEHNDGGFTFVVPKSDTKVLEIKRETRVPYSSQGYSFLSEENLGNYSDFILDMLQERLDDSYSKILYARGRQDINEFVYSLFAGYDRNHSKPANYSSKINVVKAKLEQIRREMDDYCSDPAMLQDVLCYISVPATRNIIPILQEFKNANISTYLEPAPQTKNGRNRNNRNNIQIYFERDDLDRVRDEVLSKISSPQQGLVSLRWDRKSIGTAIKEELSWKKSAEREKQE